MMMNYGTGAGGGWMWVSSGPTMVAVLVLIGATVWAIVTATTRTPALSGPAAESGGRGMARQVLDERYARGEMTSAEYTERLKTLGS